MRKCTFRSFAQLLNVNSGKQAETLGMPAPVFVRPQAHPEHSGTDIAGVTVSTNG
jgi:hypothetical protein